jgi:hypothetical protein
MLIARKTHDKLCANVGVMTGNALIDTGAILALLDRTDRWHEVCVDAFEQLRETFVMPLELLSRRSTS